MVFTYLVKSEGIDVTILILMTLWLLGDSIIHYIISRLVLALMVRETTCLGIRAFKIWMIVDIAAKIMVCSIINLNKKYISKCLFSRRDKYCTYLTICNQMQCLQFPFCDLCTPCHWIPEDTFKGIRNAASFKHNILLRVLAYPKITTLEHQCKTNWFLIFHNSYFPNID